MLNLFQHLGPKIRFALKRKKPLVAAKSHPWSFVKQQEPVLRKYRFALKRKNPLVAVKTTLSVNGPPSPPPRGSKPDPETSSG
jgi:hypothetical protein